MKIFSGSSNFDLAAKISQIANYPLGKINLESFSNGETRVWVKEENIGAKAVVLQSFSNPSNEHIIEFCLIVDALKRLGVAEITAVIPWFAYCVQDKIFRPGEPLSSKVVAKIIQNSKVNKVITIDLHNETMAGFFDIPFVHLSAVPVFIDYFKTKANFDLIVSPDVGGLKRATRFAQALDLPLATINKKRDLVTGKVKILGVNAKIEGRSVIIVDDFVSTGQTLMESAKFLKNKGVKSVSACLTHHFYIQGVQQKLEQSLLDELYVTDTIQKPYETVKYKKLKVLSVAHLIAENL